MVVLGHMGSEADDVEPVVDDAMGNKMVVITPPRYTFGSDNESPLPGAIRGRACTNDSRCRVLN